MARFLTAQWLTENLTNKTASCPDHRILVLIDKRRDSLVASIAGGRVTGLSKIDHTAAVYENRM